MMLRFTAFHGCAGTEGAAMDKSSEAQFDLHAFLASANGGRAISICRANQPVFAQGEPADSVFYIEEGKVKVTVLSEQGKEAIVAILGAGDFCGEGCLAGQPRRMATAAAMEDCKIMRLEKAGMIRLLHHEPEFSERFMAHLLARNVRVEADLVDQLFNSSEKRLARLAVFRNSSPKSFIFLAAARSMHVRPISKQRFAF
jgi:CRP/FNR family transcriptional regulator, cyclic AMP receptor protein